MTQHFVRMIFEQGIEVYRGENGAWRFACSIDEAEGPGDPHEMLKRFDVRPVVAYVRNTSNGPPLRLVLPRDLGDRLTSYGEAWEATPRSIERKMELQYIISAVYYHCGNLADAYANICRQHHKTREIPGYTPSDFVVFSGQPEAYFELEALLGAARRAYDQMASIMWDDFGHQKGRRPGNFIDTLNNSSKLPKYLSEYLFQSWENHIKILRDYRDCLMHFAALGGSFPSAFMIQNNGITTAKFRIPDNPEVKTSKKFRFDKDIDALSYGWKTTNEVFSVYYRILAALKETHAS